MGKPFRMGKCVRVKARTDGKQDRATVPGDEDRHRNVDTTDREASVAADRYLALDFLSVFRRLLIADCHDALSFADAAGRYLLLHFGFSEYDMDVAQRLFREQNQAGAAGDLRDALARIAAFVRIEEWRKREVISSMAALMTVQNPHSWVEQLDLLRPIADMFAMPPSDFTAALTSGEAWGNALIIFADRWVLAHEFAGPAEVLGQRPAAHGAP